MSAVISSVMTFSIGKGPLASSTKVPIFQKYNFYSIWSFLLSNMSFFILSDSIRGQSKHNFTLF